MSDVVHLNNFDTSQKDRVINASKTPAPVFFDRRELSLILQIYGQMVAKSEWRDYAIGQEKYCCSFAVFHRTTEKPLFRIIKEPRLANRQGAFCVHGQNDRILKRGKTLDQVLRIFDKLRFKTIK
jgi:Protein of unknown function (DUF2794)